MGEDFKLNYLFNKYKDKNIFGLTRFKKMIKKENDDFIDIIMLFNKIMDYQHEKYGFNMDDSTHIDYVSYNSANINARSKNLKNLGNVSERRERKWKYDKKVKENKYGK